MTFKTEQRPVSKLGYAMLFFKNNTLHRSAGQNQAQVIGRKVGKYFSFSCPQLSLQPDRVIDLDANEIVEVLVLEETPVQANEL